MSFWQRLRDQFRGPLRVDYGGDNETEVDDDLAEELPDAAEDAREAAEAESLPTPGGVKVAPADFPNPPETTAFEGEQEAASENAADQ